MSQLSLAVIGSLGKVGRSQDDPRKSRQWSAFGLALAIESLVIAAVVGWIAMHATKPTPAIVPISIETITEERPVPAPPEPEKARPVPVPPAPQKHVAPAKPMTVSHPAVVREPVLQAEVQPTPAAETPPVPASPPAVNAPSVAAPPPPPPSAPAGPSADYIAKVKAAVQAAVVYPPAAQALNFKGRARVEFKLRDGVSSQARILVSSGLGLVDRAALQSVQAAVYPPPPTVLQGREDTYQVWVEFNN